MAISISGAGSFTGATNEYTFDQSVGVAGTLTYEDVTDVDAVGIITAQSGLNVGPKTGIACTISSAGAITAIGFADFTRPATNGFAYLGIGPGGTNEKAIFVNRSGEIDLELYSNYSTNPTLSLNSDGSIAGTGQFTSDVQVNAGGSWDFTANTKQSYIGLGEVIVKRQNGEGSSSYGFVLKRSNGSGGVDDMITMAAEGSITAAGNADIGGRIVANGQGKITDSNEIISGYNAAGNTVTFKVLGDGTTTAKGIFDVGDTTNGANGYFRARPEGTVYIRPADSASDSSTALMVLSGSDSDATTTITKGGSAYFTSEVAIGVNSPSRSPLHINSSTADTYFHVTNSTTGSTASDGFTLHQSGTETLLNNRESGTMRFYTSGTEQMRIDSDGDVLMGGTDDSTADFVFEKGARASFYRNLYFGAADSASANTQINANGSVSFGSGGFAIDATGEISTNVKSSGHIELDSTGAFTDPKISLYANTGNIQADGTIATQAFDSSSASGYGAQINALANAGQINCQIQTGGSQFTDMMTVWFGTGIVFRVLASGNVQNTNNSYGQISDVSLKENIVDANSQWADIKSVKVRNFNFKEGQTHTQIGVIAQEIEAVSPGLVYENSDNLKGVAYSVLYMKAIKALQEAMERIETLEAKVAALEGS